MSRGLNRVKRGLAVLLSACMILGMTPIQAGAEETIFGNTLQTESTEQDVKEESSSKINRNRIVTAFAALDESVMYQQLAIGASEEEITFPDELTVTVRIQTKAGTADGEADTDNAVSTDAAENTETNVEIFGITWNLDKEESDAEEFDAGEAANGFCYVYTPVLPDTDKDGNTLAVGDDVELPAIYVLVGEPQLALLAEGDVAKVTVDNGTSTTYATVNAAIEAIQTAINDNASGDTLDIRLTFLADQTVTDLDCTLTGNGKTNLTIDMNGKTVGIDWGKDEGFKDFVLDITNINTTLTGTGTLSAIVSIKEGAELTVKDEIAFQGTLKITDGGKATLEKWKKNDGSVRDIIEIEDGGSCTITGGTYDVIKVDPGAKLEVSGDTTEIATLYAYSSVENSTVKLAEIKLSGGTYNNIEVNNSIGSSYLEDSTYQCAIIDMLASGYRFYDSSDSKTEKTPERTDRKLEKVKVLTEPEVIVSFQITKTDGTTQQKDFSTWIEAMSYLSEPGDETKFADWNKVEILLKKDASISKNVSQMVSSDKLSAELVLRSEGDAIHTLSGTNASASTALYTNGQKLTVENIKTNGASITAVDGTVTIKKGAVLTASGSNYLGGTIGVFGSTLILDDGARVTSNYTGTSGNDQSAAILVTGAVPGTLRIKKGAKIIGGVSNFNSTGGSVVVIEEGAELPTM